MPEAPDGPPVALCRARRYRTNGSVVSLASTFPSTYQGFGHVNLTSALPLPSNFLAPYLKMQIIDGESLATGGTRSLCFQALSARLPFKATLVWTDPPGSPMSTVTLVNDLNLAVADLAEPSSLWYGNHPKSTRGTAPDSVNNVEQAFSHSSLPTHACPCETLRPGRALFATSRGIAMHHSLVPIALAHPGVCP